MPDSDASIERSRSEPALRGLVEEAELLAEAVFDTVQEGLLVLDSDLRVIVANRSFYTTFQVRPVQTLDRLVYELGTGQWDIAELRCMLEEVLPHNSSFHDYEVKHEFPSIGYKVIRLNARKLRRRVDQTELILLALADITEERFLREQQQRRPGSPGLRLISLLAQQLKGTVRRHSVRGTKVEIRFPLLAIS